MIFSFWEDIIILYRYIHSLQGLQIYKINIFWGITVKIENKVEYWKNKLIDLGKRNRMINCPLPKTGKRVSRTSLMILSPSSQDLWNELYVYERNIEFPIDLMAYVEGAEESENSESGSIDKSLFLNGNKTNQSVADACKTLISLKNKAREFMENKGMNALYLAFGFLNWKENGTTGQKMRSPLLLMPVLISQESIVDSIFLAKSDDDPIFNSALSKKLFNDFNINIPEYEEGEDLQKYLKEIEMVCRPLGWTVDFDSVQLLMLSYLKMAMFHDMEVHEEEIKENPIVRALNGETDQIDFDSIPKVGSIDHDAVDPRNVFSVVDADSSQQDAISLATSGVSFVLQGPPGTGKSQTITNIIAELLGQGKKVLFVSEKVAALEVVYRRLLSAGLGDFCLTLHNPDAKRKDIMDQLAISVKLSESKATSKREAFQKLESLKLTREALNEYTKQLHTEIEPLGETIFRVNGYISQLEQYPDIDFVQENAGDITSIQLAKNINALSEFTRIISKSGYQDTNPWYGSTVNEVTHQFRQRFFAQSEKLMEYLNHGFDILLDASIIIYNGSNELTYKTSTDYEKILDCAVKSPKVPYKWLSLDISDIIAKVSSTTMKIGSKREEQKLLSFIRDINSKLDFSGSKMFESITQDNDTALNGAVVNFNAEYEQFISLLQQNDESIIAYAKTDLIFSVQQYTNILTALRDVEAAKVETKQKLQRLTEDERTQKELLDEYQKDSNAANGRITVTYKEDILTLDISELKIRFNDNYRSFMRFLNSQYRKDCKMLRSYSRTNERTSYKKAVELLEMLADAQSKKKLFDDQTAFVSEISEKIQLCNEQLNENSDTITRLQNDISQQRQKFKSAFDTFSEKLKQIVSLHEKLLAQLNDELSVLLEEITAVIEMNVNEESDFEDIIAKLKWTNDFAESTRTQNVSQDFIKSVLKADAGYIDSLIKAQNRLSDWNSCFYEQTKTFTDLFDEEHRSVFLALPIDGFSKVIENCRDNINQLETLIDYKNAVAVIKQEGLEKFLLIISELKLDSKKIVPAYKKCFYRSWLDNVIPKYDQINRFRHDRQEERIEQFRELDISHLQISQAILKGRLIEQLPNLNFSGNGDEAAILKRELNKKCRLMPIRKLIAAIPSLLPALKPCMMMSPLSVSTYFGDADFRFDTVIFDEASQVRTEEAICSILRAKQAIIAGDSKQLPPTNFFSTSASDSDEMYEDEEEINDAGAYESLLDEASIMPTQTLLWHYRSKHEHLIAFSNYKIYQKSLITFPSAVNKESDIGVEYIYVEDGIYQRGGNGGNQKEAQKISELLLEHFTYHADRSIGIIAFGEKQQNVIENEVIKFRQEHPEFEQYFRDNIDEPLFIRNLESVQGDERDTIIFSIGYGYDINGKFLMNFGPLSRDGGERRLNVAVTRARYNLKLVGSILPTDIKADRVSAIGPKLLRDYIDFAMNGETVLKAELNVSNDVWFDSPFEESVFDFLTSQGYRVATQVSCSGYRIDMAVYHPNYDGRFAIGIECDGATYHSARTARERDRLRQTILENMGWTIYRIWSTDWIKDTISEKRRLIKAINDAIVNYQGSTHKPAKAVKSVEEYLDVTGKTGSEAETLQKKQCQSQYIGNKPQDIPISDFEETILKVLKLGYGSSKQDNLIRSAAKYGYDWNRVGQKIRRQFEIALRNLEKRKTIEIKNDQIKLT